MSTIKHLESTHETAREDTPATRATWIQEQIFNNRHPRRKATEGEMQVI